MPTKVALDELRQEIDRIDDQIHDLIIERAALAGRVASAKAARAGPAAAPPAGQDASMWRPQREAQVLRRLAARHSGNFPRAAILRIWREIMSAMLSLEGRVSVAVCVAPAASGDQAADHPGFWDLAHDHFGATVAITSYQAPGAVMRAVTDDPNLVGVLPWPRDEDPDPWWRHLLGADAPRIVARLPFGDGEPALSALAVARAAVEPSGDDRSFLGIETSEAISRTRLLSCLAAAGCDAGFVATDRERPAQPVSLHLVEVAGFVGPTDKKLAAIRDAAPDAIHRAVWLGSYAVSPSGGDPVKPAAAAPAATPAAKPVARSGTRPAAKT